MKADNVKCLPFNDNYANVLKSNSFEVSGLFKFHNITPHYLSGGSTTE